MTACCEPVDQSREIAICPNYGCEPSHFERGQPCRLVGDLCSQYAGTQTRGGERSSPERFIREANR